jgi:hypothetical protein
MDTRKIPISGASANRVLDQHDLADHLGQGHDLAIEYGEISDEELIAAADALFVMYDEEERQDGHSPSVEEKP